MQEKEYYEYGELARVCERADKNTSPVSMLKKIKESATAYVIPYIRVHASYNFSYLTKLPTKSLEDTVRTVSVYFDRYVKQSGEGVVIACEVEEDSQLTALIVKEDKSLWMLKINLCDADDITDQYEMEVKDANTDTMKRNFWSTDKMTVRQFYDEFKLGHTQILEYYHPLY